MMLYVEIVLHVNAGLVIGDFVGHRSEGMVVGKRQLFGKVAVVGFWFRERAIHGVKG